MGDGNSLSDILMRALDDLSQEEYKRFKDKLRNVNCKKTSNIPRGFLDNADRIDTKNLLIEFYGEEAAVDVAIKVFNKIDQREQASKLKLEMDKVLDYNQKMYRTKETDYKKKYREHILEAFQMIADVNADYDEAVLLNKRYTRLMLLKKQRHQEETELEIMTKGETHMEIMNEQDSPGYCYSDIENLFGPDEEGRAPKTVVLYGPAGIGKTMTMRKIMLDWAAGELYQSRFDYVFYVPCSKVSSCHGDKSIADLIVLNVPEKNAPIKGILEAPEKLLFIIDGFNELRWPSDQPASNVCYDPYEKKTMDIVLINLLKRNILPRAHLMITTRPALLDRLKEHLEFPRVAEILGFSKKDRKEYFYRFFRDEQRAAKAFRFVTENEILFTMCFVPIVCWIVCTVVQQQMDRCEGLSHSSKTTTSVYVLYLTSLIRHHSSILKAPILKYLRKLCSLAEKGIRNKKILFEEKEITKRGLDRSDLLCLLLNRHSFKKDIGYRRVYSFIHLSFQEFFAAMFYILERKKTMKNILRPKRSVQQLLCKYREGYVTVMRFLFGLFNTETMRHLEETLGCRHSLTVRSDSVGLLKERAQGRISSKWNCQTELFYCLYEMQDNELVGEMMKDFQNIHLDNGHFSKMDHVVLSFCLRSSHVGSMLCLNKCMMGIKEWKALTSKPINCMIITLRCCSIVDGPFARDSLNGDRLEEKDLSLSWRCKWERASFKKQQHELRIHPTKELNVLFQELGDSEVKQLCEGLKHPSCELEKLRLANCSLTAACCKYLSSVISRMHSLLELKLQGDKLGDLGVRQLCEALKQPACRLQILWLQSCGLTEACCEDLSSVLCTNVSLKELDLMDNELRDSGVRRLCEGLRHVQCRLQSLQLRRCCLTAACCVDFSSVFSENRSLVELNLEENQLGDSGVRHLHKKLRHPDCKLQKLRLDT